MREPYILYKRGKMFYVAFWDIDERRYSSWRSCGALRSEIGRRAELLNPRAKSGAGAIVRLWRDVAPTQSGDLVFLDYLREFWAHDGEYARKKKDAGCELSSGYLRLRNFALKRVVEFLEFSKQEKILLGRVTAKTLEDLSGFCRRELSLSASRTNAILITVFIPLKNALRLGFIREDPSQKISLFAETKPIRKPLTPDEVRAFFSLDWKDERYRTINLLSATTGMRIGECLALKTDCIHVDWIDVKRNFQAGEGLKLPKGGKIRAVPCPPQTVEALNKLSGQNPWGNDFIFFGGTREAPLSPQTVGKSYRSALLEIGISKEESRERKLTFHAWRHWYNSMLRGRVPDHALRRLTGHSSEGMTEHYTAITEAQRKAVAELAEGLV